MSNDDARSRAEQLIAIADKLSAQPVPTKKRRPWALIAIAVVAVAGIVGGALWGGLVGLLKAKTGAHEVILTIMLNYVAFYLLLWMLRTPAAANVAARPTTVS